MLELNEVVIKELFIDVMGLLELNETVTRLGLVKAALVLELNSVLSNELLKELPVMTGTGFSNPYSESSATRYSLLEALYVAMED